ncbi:unnamed protein product [Staurois parvus]|uniref:Signal sequence receptor subunit 2 n=1 Tax=Staurois parvus TaxID=386267 RepID=A0ABN9FPS6_9NEOB|nr:unnamed protein product [Staurois parvus]
MKTVLVAFAVLLALGHCEEGARLLASKSLLNRYAVEGKDLTLQYNIYNVGSSLVVSLIPDVQRQQRLSHRGPASSESRLLQLHFCHHHLPGSGGRSGCGGVHQRPGTRRNSGSA